MGIPYNPNEKHLGKYNPMGITNIWGKSVGGKNVRKWELNIPLESS
jgi:hypothetical protein